MTVCTNTLRNGLLVVLVVASVVGFASLAGGANPGGATDDDRLVQEDAAVFENRTVVEQRGDVVQLSVLFRGADRATVTVGSPDVNFEASFTVVDGDGDGEATVELNTAAVGLEDDSSAVTALGEDEVEGYERTTGPIPGPLDAALYDLELSVDGRLTDVGALVLNERSTEDASVWAAPDAARPNDSAALLDSIARTDRIAQGDWAVLAVEVSGVFGYVESAEDLDDPANGLNLSIVEDPGRNLPERPANLSNLSVVTDATNDTLFVLLDTDDLTVGSEYNATFAIDDRNPYLESGENESASATFTVVERNATDANATETDGVTETEVADTETRTTASEPTTGEPATTTIETTEGGITEEVVRTTTFASSSVTMAGPTGKSVGLVAVLIGATMVVLRRG